MSKLSSMFVRTYFLAALLVSFWSPTDLMASDFSTICTSSTPATLVAPKSTTQLIPGRYFNLKRSGQGWDFFWYGNLQESSPGQADKLFVAYYSYEKKPGTVDTWVPVWYGATFDPSKGTLGFSPGTPGSTPTHWDGILYRYKQVAFANGGFGPIRQMDPGNGASTPSAERVGEVTIYFGSNGITPGQRPDRAAVSWRLTNQTFHPGAPDARIEDCLGNFVASQLVQDGRSGLWADENSASGWFWIPVYWQPSGEPVQEHHLVAFFDQGGNPSWILGGAHARACFPNFAPGQSYPPAETAPAKAVCAMRSKGYPPWKLLCGQPGAPADCANWNSADYVIRVGKLVRMDTATTSEGVNRATLAVVREVGQVPIGGMNTDTSELSVAMTATNPAAPRAPFANPSAPYTTVVSQLNGLTRLRADFDVGNSDSDNAGFCRLGNSTDGLCRMRVHFMTEGAHPALTIVRRRNAAPFGGSDVAVVSTGVIRSPVDGLPVPATNSVTGAEALIVGDKFQFEAHATADTSGAPLFKTRQFEMAKSLGGYCLNVGAAPPSVPTPTLTVGAVTGDGAQFRVETSQAVVGNPSAMPILGIRLRVYESNPIKLAVEKLVPISTTQPINQTISVSGLTPGQKYRAAADVFNICASARGLTAEFAATDYETPDDSQFNASWAPSQASDGGNSNAVAGAMPIQVQGSGGSAAVNIPIEIAPGRHGMQPQLALAYSSRGGNGLAGMGWSLSGTSSIHRCPRTIDQDANNPGGVEFSNEDRLCLDGQRLVAVSGAYGAANTEYRTEVDQFLRVRQLGGDLVGSSTSFTVEYSNGQKALYGDNAVSGSSRVDVSVNALGSRTLSWQLSRRQDGAGNTVNYYYNQSLYTNGTVGSGESLLTRITYTGFVDGAGAVTNTGSRKVEFCYEERPGATQPTATNPCAAKEPSVWNNAGADTSSSYLAGARIEQTRRLRTITVTNNSAQVRRYELNYAAPSAYSGRSLLRDVLVCGSNSNSCLPKTVFAWNERSGPNFKFRHLNEIDSIIPLPEVNPISGEPFTPNDPKRNRILQSLGDLDGDGVSETLVTDTLAPYRHDNPRTNHVVRLNADRSGAQLFQAPGDWFLNDPHAPFRWVDLNNDGRSDVWIVDRSESGCNEFIDTSPGSFGGEIRTAVRECDAAFRLRVGTYVGEIGQWNPDSFAYHADTFANSGLLETTKAAYTYTISVNGVTSGHGPPYKPANHGAHPFHGLEFSDQNGDGLKDLVVTRRVPWSDPWAQTCKAVPQDVSEQHLGVAVLQVFRNTTVRGTINFRFSDLPTYTSCLRSGPGAPPYLSAELRRLQDRHYTTGSLIPDMDGDGLADLTTRNPVAHRPQYHFARRQCTPPEGCLAGWGDLRDLNDPLAPLISELGPKMGNEYEPWWGVTTGEDSESRYAVLRMDINGDGLQDIVYGNADPRYATVMQSVRLNTGRKGRNASLYTAAIAVLDGAGSPNGAAVTVANGARFTRPHDVDSDGRPEIISPGSFAARVCSMLYVNSNEQRYEYADERGTLVESSDHAPNSPNAVLNNYYFCPGTPEQGVLALTRGTAIAGVPTREMYRNGWGTFDSSLYFAKAFRFVESIEGGSLKYRLVSLGQTDLITDASGSVQDVFGDGLDDGAVHFQCKDRRTPDITGKRCEIPNTGNVHCENCMHSTSELGYGPTALPDGTPLLAGNTVSNAAYRHYISENLGTFGSGHLPAATAPPLPELLASAAQLSATSTPLKQWQFSYQPLSSRAGRGPDELPLYEVPSTGLRGTAREKHFYFTSSMPVLSTYTETVNGGNGQRVYQRTHSFGYREALYNNAGRGFRGFRDITEETDSLTTSGDLLPGTRTMTRFEHYFPMSGLVSCSVSTSSFANPAEFVCPAATQSTQGGAHSTSDSTPGTDFRGVMSRESRSYSVTSTAGRFSVLPVNVSSETFDPAVGSRISLSESSYANYDSYGHAALETASASDFVGLSSGAITRTSIVKSHYTPLVDASTWWTDRLARRSQTSTVVDARLPNGASPPSQSSTTLIGYDATTRQPTCQMVFNGALDTLSTSHADNCANSVVGGWASSAKTTFDTFGNPSSVTQYIKDESLTRTSTTQWCDTAPCTSASPDGYFPLRVFNAKGHATCSTFDGGHGVALTVRQPMTTNSSCAAGGLETRVTLDAFGRAIKQEFPTASTPAGVINSALPQHTARQWCSSPGRCPGSAVAAVLREVVEQQGAPTGYRFFDAEGHVVAEIAQHFDGSGLRSVYRSFDDFGRLRAESQPTLESGPQFNTEHAYDVYGRLIAKWTRRLRLDGVGGESAMLTQYYPDGPRTDITVRNCSTVIPPPQVGEAPICNGPQGHLLAMSRLYSSGGKVLETTDAEGGDTRFVYDGGGNVVQLTDANGNSTTAVYDGLGRRLSSQDPNQGARSYVYNGAGELKSETDARGWSTTFAYDELGRLIQRNWNEQALAPNTSNLRDNGVDTWVYDVIGAGVLSEERRTLTRAGGSLLESARTTFEVDELYRGSKSTRTIKTPTGDESFVSTTRFDKKFGRAKQATMPGGVSVVYRYNAQGFALGEALLEQATDPNQYLRKVTTQDAFGNATGVGLSSGAMKRLMHTDVSTGWVKRICSGTGNFSCSESTSTNNTQALDVSYRYDGYGNVIGATNAGRKIAATVPVVESYGYDDLHRLTRNSGGLVTVDYAYDAVGNILKKTDFSQNAANAYSYSTHGSGPNAVSEVAIPLTTGCTSPAVSRTHYWYDANGNQTGRQIGCAASARSDWTDYSIDNLPRQIAHMPGTAFGTAPSAGTIPAPNNLTRFHYGPDGQRTLQVLQFDVTKSRTTVYAGGYERDSYTDGRIEHRYAIAPGVLLIRNTTDSTRNGTYYTHTDRLGSTSTVTRADGTIMSQNGFDAFGMPRDADWKMPSWGWSMASTLNGAGYTNPGITRRGFTDHEQLDQLGLTHMNGRLYDYRLGRFLGVDPIIQFPTNSQSLNPYSYIMNNPLSGTDPTGYAACDTVAANQSAVSGSCTHDLGGGRQIEVNYSFDKSGNLKVSSPDVTGASVVSLTGGGKALRLDTKAYGAVFIMRQNGVSEGTSARGDKQAADTDASDIDAIHQRTNTAFQNAGKGLNSFADYVLSPCDNNQSAGRCGKQVVTNTVIVWGGLKAAESIVSIWRGLAKHYRNIGDDAAGDRVEAEIADYLAGRAAKSSHGLGVTDPPSRYEGPWTQRDLARAQNGQGPLDIVQLRNRKGREMPLELHHADQMPGSAIHEVDSKRHRQPDVHGQPKQGVTPEMRKRDMQLHWQLRGQEMGNPSPGGN